MTVSPVPNPRPRLSIGVTGHRSHNPAFSAHQERVDAALRELFDQLDTIVSEHDEETEVTRLHSLLANGVDQLAAKAALERGWELVAPLPFGRTLNMAINASPKTLADAQALLREAKPEDPNVAAQAKAIQQHAEKAHLFEIADQDELIENRFLEALGDRGDRPTAQSFEALCAEQVVLAGRVMIEQSDFIIGVWDGEAKNFRGGTGHTIAAALSLGVPAVLIDPTRADDWTIVTIPEGHAQDDVNKEDRSERLARLVRHALAPSATESVHGSTALTGEKWHQGSSRRWLAYRWIERAFSGRESARSKLLSTYEKPGEIEEGSGAKIVTACRNVPGADPEMVTGIAKKVLPDFAWADGISTWLSDAYRSGMVANFCLSALAVIIGLSYQPLGFDDRKWLFASLEFFLLTLILVITFYGTRQRWHRRWFDTRRTAEYLRHAPALLMLGIARPAARWPRGGEVSWPEYHARHRLRSLGLPRTKVTKDYVRAAVETILLPHVEGQCDYHRLKAERLERVHRNLDKLAIRFFSAAVIAVSIYLMIELLALLHVVDKTLPKDLAKIFTFMGVAFPTLAASVSAIRYFGDFERFAAISRAASEKLDAVRERIKGLLAGPSSELTYASAVELGRVVEEITISEIESWQAVFGGKHISLPA